MTKTPASLLERLRRPGDQEAWERFVQREILKLDQSLEVRRLK